MEDAVMDRLDRIETALRYVATYSNKMDSLDLTKAVKGILKDRTFDSEGRDISEKMAHLSHCYQGEYSTSCKYGESDCPEKPTQPVIDEIIDKAMLDKNTISRFSGDGSPEDVYHTITLTTKALFKILSQYKLERK